MQVNFWKNIFFWSNVILSLLLSGNISGTLTAGCYINSASKTAASFIEFISETTTCTTTLFYFLWLKTRHETYVVPISPLLNHFLTDSMSDLRFGQARI